MVRSFSRSIFISNSTIGFYYKTRSTIADDTAKDRDRYITIKNVNRMIPTMLNLLEDNSFRAIINI